MSLYGLSGANTVRHAIDTLPMPEGRDRATLLSVARVLPGDMVDRVVGGGVEWVPWPDVAANHVAVGCDETYDKTAREVPSLVAQAPFAIWDRVQCSTAGLELPWLADAVGMGIDRFVSAQYAMELEDPTDTNGVGLTGNVTYPPAVVTSSASSLGVALAELEGYLAEQGGGGKPGMRGVIHLTPGLLVLAVGEGYVEFRDGYYRTPTGHLVVADAGHTGTAAPYGQSAPSSGSAWIYATGDVFYALGSMGGLSVMDPTDADGGPVYVAQNKMAPLGERMGLVVFDPNVLGAALVDLSASSGSGGSSAVSAVSAAEVGSVDDNTSTAVSLADANSSRSGLLVVNDAGSSGILYVKYGTGASASDYTVPIAVGGYWEMPDPIYTGVVSGIWASDGDGTAMVTEL